MRFSLGFALFPLNGGAGLGGEVVEDAVDVVDLGGDALGDVLEKGERDVFYGGGHSVGGIDRADDDGIGKGTLAVLDADGFEIGYRGEVLPNLALKTVFREFFAEDRVALAHSFQTVAGDSA